MFLVEYNYKIYNKKLLAIIKVFKESRFKLFSSKDSIYILSNY